MHGRVNLLATIPEWGLLCLVFMVGAFEQLDGGYSSIPTEASKIEIRMPRIKGYFLRVDGSNSEIKWFGSLNGKIFFTDMEEIGDFFCAKDKEEGDGMMRDGKTLKRWEY